MEIVVLGLYKYTRGPNIKVFLAQMREFGISGNKFIFNSKIKSTTYTKR